MAQKNQIIKLIIFIVSNVSVFGSLYFSEIMKLPPCDMCWYQRIFLYPVAIISLVNIIKNNYNDHLHELVLCSLGFLIAFYHNLLYYGVIENIVPCSQGISCTSRQIEWFGFITIPLLSGIAFITIIGAILFGALTKESPQNVNK